MTKSVPMPGEILTPLPPPFRAPLLSMYSGEQQLGGDGERHDLDETIRISPEQGMWLYGLCRETKPKNTLEIGLAYGFSMFYFLAAIHQNGIGHHTAVDPYQRDWHGIGRRQSQSLDMGNRFRFVEERSVSALVHFADRGETFEVIFIDGNHRFDDAFVDFTLSADLCPMGGCIILDDLWMPSIRAAAAFVRSNRKDFEEIKTSLSNIAAFRRVGEDARKWDHYVDFVEIGKRRAIRRLTQVLTR
jgi:predicted O-methyltransferase YrrM